MTPERYIPVTESRGEYPWADGRRTLTGRVSRVLGIRRTFTVDGVRYREVTTEPLRTALGKHGPGYKDFDVRFRAGERMRIRCTKDRVFADLAPPPRLPVIMRVERLLRPGMRVLVMPCGTGYGAAAVAGRVLPSGAVVALDPDAESIEFARLRYPIQCVSFESGDITSLQGETDGAFDAVVVVNREMTCPDDEFITELWRVIAAGGWLAIAHACQPSQVLAESTNDVADALARLCTSIETDAPGSSAHVGPLGDGRDGWIGAIARRDTPA